MRNNILALIAIMVSTLLPHQASAGSDAGRVMYVSGEVWVLSKGKSSSIAKGDKVFPHDVVVTGDRGRIKLQMIDNTVVYVGSKSRVEIQQYKSTNKGLFSGTFNMLWGKARFMVNKLIHKDSSFNVKTHTATIGVRGTEFSVEVPSPTGLNKSNARQLQSSLKVPNKPVVMMLFEGSVVGKSFRGAQKIIKPGSLAKFTPQGKILTRKITQKDIKLLSLPKLKRLKISKDRLAPLQSKVGGLKGSAPSGKAVMSSAPSTNSVVIKPNMARSSAPSVPAFKAGSAPSKPKFTAPSAPSAPKTGTAPNKPSFTAPSSSSTRGAMSSRPSFAVPVVKPVNAPNRIKRPKLPQ